MISRSIKGVCSELIAAKEFLNKGYYVARSLDPQCPFDIVVVDKKGKATLYDVKSVSRRKTQSYNCKRGDTINRSVSKKQKSMGIKIYYAEGS
jgi:ribosomal protein L11